MRHGGIHAFLTAAALLFSGAPLSGAAPALPNPARYVTDNAGVLPADRAAALNEKLAAFERATSTQILVYTDHRVPEGATLEELASRSFRDWGVGQKGRSNGIVFFVFPDDRKMRVEVGYGLEGAVPDARAHRITDEIVKPRFRAGDFAGGIEAGADALMAAARGEPWAGNGQTSAEARRGSSARVSPGVVAAIVLGGFTLALAGLVIFLILRARRRGGFGSAAPTRPASAFSGPASSFWTSSSSDSSCSSSSSSDDSSSSSSSSSSSDFSGGGGDSGGGGSSDSW